MGHESGAHRAPRDWVWAIAVGAFALAVYVWTLAPGVVAEADTPMFQFVGRVLGVAHNPGYPLYVLLTAPIARLPVGSLPWRINLFSAVCGAIAVALVFLVSRRLGCRRAAGALAALGLAFGPIFWSQSVIAEVYTLHAAFVATVLLGLLDWGATRRKTGWYTAAGAMGAGLAHHTTILAFLPAALVYAWISDRTFLLRARTLLTTTLAIAAGLIPYLFIVIRSNQPGAYLESAARTIGSLPGVFLARQFQDRVMAFDWTTVATSRLPSLVRGPLLAELTLAGALLAVVGIVSMGRTRRGEALLLGLGGLTVLAFAAGYDVVDTPVFLIPVVLVLWLFAGAGAERLASVTPARGAATSAICLLLAWQLTHNYAQADRSHDVATAVTLDRLFEALPSRVRLVHEDFLVDRLVQFKRFTDPRVSREAIDLVNRDADVIVRALDRGLPVYAFDKSARRVRLEGLSVSFDPLGLPAVTLNALLDGVEHGSAVVMAAPSSMASRFAGSGVSLERVTANPPAGVSVETTETEAAIRRGGRDLIRTSEGVAFAAWRPDGRLTHLLVLSAVDGFRASPPAGPLALYRVQRGETTQVATPDGVDVTASFASGVAVVRVPPAQTLTFQIDDVGLLAPRAMDRAGVSVDVTAMSTGHAIAITNEGRSGGAALLTLGGRPGSVVARTRVASSPASITAVDVTGLLRRRDRRTETLLMARDDQALLVGAGWSRVDADAGGGYRWMAADTAGLVLPLTPEGGHRLRAQVQHVAGNGASATLEVVADGVALGERALQHGWNAYDWDLPGHLDGPRVVNIALVAKGARPATSSVPGAVALADVHVLSR